MFRFAFFSLIVVISTLALIASLFLIFAAIRWSRQLFLASTQFISKQYQAWRTKKDESSIPDFLQSGKEQLSQVDQLTNELTPKWQSLLSPVIEGSQYLLSIGLNKPEQAEQARSFFTVTLKALASFTKALANMEGEMQEAEEDKAKMNIEVFMNDIYKYRAKIEAKKRFDFHVVMEMIKQRIGK